MVPSLGVEPRELFLLREVTLPICPKGHCLVVPTGFEPVTFTMSRYCATTAPRNCMLVPKRRLELLRCYAQRPQRCVATNYTTWAKIYGTSGGDRTHSRTLIWR